MARHFGGKGLPVPRLLAVSKDELLYLQEDLGDLLLFDYIKKGRLTGVFSPDEKAVLHRTMELLPRFQVLGAENFDFTKSYPQPEFNRRSVLWDLNYFKYCFLKATGLEFQQETVWKIILKSWRIFCCKILPIHLCTVIFRVGT